MHVLLCVRLVQVQTIQCMVKIVPSVIGANVQWTANLVAAVVIMAAMEVAVRDLIILVEVLVVVALMELIHRKIIFHHSYFPFVEPGVEMAIDCFICRGSGAECHTCHGDGNRGKDDVPGIAGRSPTSLMRQLYDFKSGARRGGKSSEMDKVVWDMTEREMLALSAYLGSLKP